VTCPAAWLLWHLLLYRSQGPESNNEERKNPKSIKLFHYQTLSHH